MKKFIQIFITILCVFIMTSCTKFEVKEINKDLRVISYTYADGKIKLINQKFNSNHQAWYDAKCKKVEYKYFKEGFKYNFLNCTKENIIFTKTSLVKIRKLESGKNNESNNSPIIITANSQEKSSSQEQEEFEEPFNPTPPGDCVGGDDVC